MPCLHRTLCRCRSRYRPACPSPRPLPSKASRNCRPGFPVMDSRPPGAPSSRRISRPSPSSRMSSRLRHKARVPAADGYAIATRGCDQTEFRWTDRDVFPRRRRSRGRDGAVAAEGESFAVPFRQITHPFDVSCSFPRVEFPHHILTAHARTCVVANDEADHLYRSSGFACADQARPLGI